MSKLPSASEWRQQNLGVGYAGALALAQVKLDNARSVAGRKHWRTIVSTFRDLVATNARLVRATERREAQRLRALQPKPAMPEALKATLRAKQDQQKAAARAAHVAEVEEARPFAAVLLDALEESDDALANWQVEAAHFDEYQDDLPPEKPRTKLDVMQADHAKLNAAWRVANSGPVLVKDKPHPLHAGSDLRAVLGVRALQAYKLEHSRARGDRHWIFRSAVGSNVRGAGAHVCRYCATVLGSNAMIGNMPPDSGRRHAERCALQYLAGIRVAVAPGTVEQQITEEQQ